MASFDVLHTESNSGSFPSGDYSFLPEVSVHSVQNGTISHIKEDFNLTNMQSALTTTSSPDISMEEVNARLMELLDENRSLKDALNKNNLLMKDQMGTISAWRENMIMSMTQKQQNLEKFKEKVSLLEKNNADLHNKLSSLEMECLDLRNPESCKNCEGMGDVLQSLQEERETAEKTRDLLSGEVGEFKNFHKHLRENLMAIYNHLDHLYCTAKLTEKQKGELNNVLICLRMKIGVLTEEFGSITHTDDETGYVIIKEQQKLQTSEELTIQTSTEIENLRKELEEKIKKLQTFEELSFQTSTEIENLRKLLEEKNKKVEDTEKLLCQSASEMEHLRMNLEAKSKKLDLSCKQEKQLNETVKAYDKRLQDVEKQLKAQLEELNNKLDIESTLNRKYKERCQNLQRQIDECQVKLKNVRTSDDQSIVQLREDSLNLQEILQLEQRASQEDKEKIATLKIQCENLQVDYDRVCQLFEIQTRDGKKLTEELTSLRENSSSQMEAVDHLTARVMDLELRLEEKEEEMKKMIEELVSIKEEAEMVPILQTQPANLKPEKVACKKKKLDIHKTDLEQAVSTRDSAYAEIDKLEKELKRYRRDSDSSGYHYSRKGSGRK